MRHFYFMPPRQARRSSAAVQRGDAARLVNLASVSGGGLEAVVPFLHGTERFPAIVGGIMLACAVAVSHTTL